MFRVRLHLQRNYIKHPPSAIAGVKLNLAEFAQFSEKQHQALTLYDCWSQTLILQNSLNLQRNYIKTSTLCDVQS